MHEWKQRLVAWCDACRTDSAVVRFALPDPVTVGITLARVMSVTPNRLLIVAPDSSTAEDLSIVLPTYQQMVGDERPVVLIPEVVTGRANQWLPENEAARCAALDAVVRNEPGVFVASVAALLTPALAPSEFAEHTFVLRVGDGAMSPQALAERLVTLDYDNEFEVHVPGEFARRGGILDVYSPLNDAPVRIEFFGDTVESMRFFLPETQRSFREVAELRIVPRGAMVSGTGGDGGASISAYFDQAIPVAVCQRAAVSAHLEQYTDTATLAAWDRFVAGRDRILLLETELTDTAEAADSGPERPVIRADCVSLGDELGPLLPELGEGAVLWHWQQLRDHLLRWQSHGYALVAFCGGKGERQRFRELLAEDPKTADLDVCFEPYRLDTGLLVPPARVVLLSEREIFGRQPDAHRRRKARYHFDLGGREAIELEEGSYAVHAGHGVCRYCGIRTIETTGELQEVMELEFDDDARLYVPLDQSHLVTRYVGGTKKMPKLNRLGGAAWQSTKDAAAGAAWDLAAELLRLEALRRSSTGVAFEQSVDWETAFAGAFPYVETDDQEQAIRETLTDMESDKPMDRLLCGDVGYGKTEVAMRAAFRAVLNNRQVAVLVPTTVLAQQHFVTFRERMGGYPIEIEVLSRFRTKAEQRAVLEKVALGRVDIVIGTHRLLQRDVAFSDLGLLIIDEEQRFGVAHKQRLKKMRAHVDILTMTATPIPRTLYFSLSGLRHLSTIMTAPAERLPVTTIVAQFDWDLIRQAISRELERGGQVYFLHNRVQSIDRIAAGLRQLLPKARFGVGHGQMPGHSLAEVMSQFVHGRIDVLVCTTIIESGLDIPNANTIIIDRADRFGLADLYQLRGRVGRYHRQAYAYLLLPPMGALPENARQRLAAIRRYTHLGAGFKLALRDLEIRGAGNILGTEQSGHIAAVGFELYCELLKEAVARQENLPSAQQHVIPVHLDTLVYAVKDGRGRELAAFPQDYVGSEEVRLACYRRVNALTGLEDLDQFAGELTDRFGERPGPVENLLAIARVRILAQRAGVISVAAREGRAFLETERGLVKDRRNRLPQLESGTGAGQLRELCKLLLRLSSTALAAGR